MLIILYKSRTENKVLLKNHKHDLSKNNFMLEFKIMFIFYLFYKF